MVTVPARWFSFYRCWAWEPLLRDNRSNEKSKWNLVCSMKDSQCLSFQLPEHSLPNLCTTLMSQGRRLEDLFLINLTSPWENTYQYWQLGVPKKWSAMPNHSVSHQLANSTSAHRNSNLSSFSVSLLNTNG